VYFVELFGGTSHHFASHTVIINMRIAIGEASAMGLFLNLNQHKKPPGGKPPGGFL